MALNTRSTSIMQLLMLQSTEKGNAAVQMRENTCAIAPVNRPLQADVFRSTDYRKRSTVQNTSELLSGVSRRVQRYLLTVRNTNFSVLFMATRLVHFVCQSSQNGALLKPEHSISAHKVK